MTVPRSYEPIDTLMTDIRRLTEVVDADIRRLTAAVDALAEAIDDLAELIGEPIPPALVKEDIV